MSREYYAAGDLVDILTDEGWVPAIISCYDLITDKWWVEVQDYDPFFGNEFKLVSTNMLKKRGEWKSVMLRCECGCDSVGSAFHSDWCPKYEKQ